MKSIGVIWSLLVNTLRQVLLYSLYSGSLRPKMCTGSGKDRRATELVVRGDE